MRALSQIERTDTDRIDSETSEVLMAGAASGASFAAHVSVYRLIGQVDGNVVVLIAVSWIEQKGVIHIV